MSDVQKLIAEARSRALTAQGIISDSDPLGLNTQLLIRLADALETVIAERDASDRAFQALKTQGGARDAELVSLKAKLAVPSPVGPEGDVVERVARHLANLDDGESWPGNSELGGSLTGTRDDEYRAAMQDEAREILALIGFSRPVGGETVTEWEWAVRVVGEDEPFSLHYDSRIAMSNDMEGVSIRGGEELVRRRAAGPWTPVSPEQDEDEFQPGECTGSDSCTVPVHIHGCFADTEGACDDPSDHPKGPEQDGGTK